MKTLIWASLAGSVSSRSMRAAIRSMAVDGPTTISELLRVSAVIRTLAMMPDLMSCCAVGADRRNCRLMAGGVARGGVWLCRRRLRL